MNPEKNEKLPKELYEIISKVMKYIEKTEQDFVESRKNEEDKNENS